MFYISTFHSTKLVPILLQIYGKTLMEGRFSPIFFNFALIFILRFQLLRFYSILYRDGIFRSTLYDQLS